MTQDYASYEVVAQPVFVLRQDATGAVVYAFMNAAGRDVLQCGPEHVIGRSARDLYPGRLGAAVYQRHRAAWHGGRTTTYDVSLPVPCGVLNVTTTLIPVRDAAGRLVQMVGTSRDVTRLRQLEQLRAVSTAMTREIEDFVNLAAHDLRSPIANVQSLADLIREDFVDMGDGKLEMLAMIEEISARALTMVSDMLVQARSVDAPPAARPVPLADLGAELMVMLDPTGAHELHVPEVTLHGDHTLLHIVMRNLIDNALKHARRDRVRITVGVTQADGDRLCLTVTDNGQGFADPDAAFAETRETRADGGFGLLGIRRLLRSRGGDIAVLAGCDGGGASLRLTMPGALCADRADADADRLRAAG